MQEFPKALYRGGDLDSDYVIVQDADEEQAQRAEGFGGEASADSSEAPKRGRGRPKKS